MHFKCDSDKVAAEPFWLEKWPCSLMGTLPSTEMLFNMDQMECTDAEFLQASGMRRQE